MSEKSNNIGDVYKREVVDVQNQIIEEFGDNN
jgi:hypothetical protein